jgi:eukaryotic-like serine/threonine-protein kinase
VTKELSANTTLSHYRIVSKLGAGGMGEVYLAYDTKLDRKVAIKFLADDSIKDADKLKRFIQEAKAASALNHPNILTVYEIGEVDGKNYIATELIEGHTLRSHLAQEEALPLNAILKIGIQVAEALAAAHQAGIIHRDIKPENIMLREDGYAKVLDFGLAKLTETKNRKDISLESETKAFVQTSPGIVMGTVSYMSPEQARGKETDARTDLWSLGVVLYEMLERKVPFTGETINHTIVAILEKDPLPLENVPDELQRIVRKALTKEKEMRYQTARDFLIDLENLRRNLDIKGELERSAIPNKAERTAAGNSSATRINAFGVVTQGEGGVVKPKETTSLSSLEYALTQAKSHKLATAIAVMVLLGIIPAVAYFGFFARANAGQIDSIAVLPFANKTGNPDSEYLSDGLAESLIYRLSQLPNLKVSPTSSVMRYKGKDIDANAIAGELGVSAVMTGRIAQRGDGLIISVELIDGRNNKLIWGEQYDRKMADLLATQREIASVVTEKLQLKLSGEDAKGITKRYTNNSEAYQLYLKGRHYWNKRTPDNIRKAIEQFKAAADKDPGFALAYVGLADAHMVLLYYTRTSGREVIPQAKAYAARALEIDDSLAEAHASMGIINNLSWNWAESEKDFKRAIELNPNYATARHWYSRYLRTAGRLDEALVQIRQAHETDPLSLAINDNLAENLMEQGDVNGAIEQCNRSLELDPNYWAAHRTLASAYLKQGRNTDALVEIQKAVKLLNNESVSLKTLGYVQAVSGNRKEALAIVKELEERYPKQQADGRDIAEVYAGLGEKDQVFAWLEKDFQRHDHSLAQLRLEASFDFLRDDPRFKDLLRRMGLTP